VQYIFLWAKGRQTQGPPLAAHTLATPLVAIHYWNSLSPWMICV